jgi:hypothetical protein
VSFGFGWKGILKLILNASERRSLELGADLSLFQKSLKGRSMPPKHCRGPAGPTCCGVTRLVGGTKAFVFKVFLKPFPHVNPSLVDPSVWFHIDFLDSCSWHAWHDRPSSGVLDHTTSLFTPSQVTPPRGEKWRSPETNTPGFLPPMRTSGCGPVGSPTSWYTKLKRPLPRKDRAMLYTVEN